MVAWLFKHRVIVLTLMNTPDTCQKSREGRRRSWCKNKTPKCTIYYEDLQGHLLQVDRIWQLPLTKMISKAAIKRKRFATEVYLGHLPAVSISEGRSRRIAPCETPITMCTRCDLIMNSIWLKSRQFSPNCVWHAVHQPDLSDKSLTLWECLIQGNSSLTLRTRSSPCQGV
jgi:hypothetical protein